MSIWEMATWLAVAILGPGAVVVFWFFLRDVRKIVSELGKVKTRE